MGREFIPSTGRVVTKNKKANFGPSNKNSAISTKDIVTAPSGKTLYTQLGSNTYKVADTNNLPSVAASPASTAPTTSKQKWNVHSVDDKAATRTQIGADGSKVVLPTQVVTPAVEKESGLADKLGFNTKDVSYVDGVLKRKSLEQAILDKDISANNPYVKSLQNKNGTSTEKVVQQPAATTPAAVPQSDVVKNIAGGLSVNQPINQADTSFGSAMYRAQNNDYEGNDWNSPQSGAVYLPSEHYNDGLAKKVAGPVNKVTPADIMAKNKAIVDQQNAYLAQQAQLQKDIEQKNLIEKVYGTRNSDSWMY